MTDPDSVSEVVDIGTAFMEAVDEGQAKLDKGEKVEDDSDDEDLEEGSEDEEDSSEDSDEDEDEDEEDEDEEDSEDDSVEEEVFEDDEEEPEDSKDEVKATKPKVHTATLPDGTQVKLTDDATVKIKVDGKFQRVAVKDLTSAYNGNVKHDELIRRGAEKVKELELQSAKSVAEAQRMRSLTKAFMDGATKGDLIEAMSIVAELTNEKDPQKVLNDFISGIGKAVDQYAAMSPEEVERRAREFKVNAELQKKERKLKEIEAKEKIEEAKKLKEVVKQELGLEEEDMRQAYDALNARNEALAKAGKPILQFSLKDVGDLAVDYRHYDSFTGLVKKYKVEATSADINNLIDIAKIQARKLKRWPSKTEYVQMLSTYANKEIQGISRKVGSIAKTTPKNAKKKSRNEPERVINRISSIWD